MDRYELAWAAGFFDGEGWAAAVRQSGRTNHQPRAQVNQAGAGRAPEALERFRAALGGLGRIGGPYAVPGRKDLYHWVISSRADVELLHHLLAPWLGDVKLRALAAALDRPPATARVIDDVTDEWRAWAAGLFDGEGSIYLLEHRSHEGRRIGEIVLTQAGDGASPSVLRRLMQITGRGQIYGPYSQPGARRDIYRWKVTAQDAIAPTMEVLSPWLGEVKRAQTADVLSVLREQMPLPRGNPEWGNRKTHCIHGHEYATARVRPFVARRGGEQPRDSEQCLQCAREQARERRAQNKSAADPGGRSVSEFAARYLLK